MIDTIAILCSRADTTWNRLNNKDNKVLFNLSENDKKLIYNSELWNLCLGNQTYSSYGYSHKSVGAIIKNFAF